MSEAAEVRYCYRHPDRETGLSCSECGRPICYECMTPAPVGLRCPDHSGKPKGVRRVTTGVRRASYEGTGALVTKALIVVNVLVYLAQIAEGASINRTGGTVYERGALVIRGELFDGTLVGLAEGEWWRLLTATFLHASLYHIGLNMLVLWAVGAGIEQYLGRGRFLLLYVVSGLAGSAGALLLSPGAITVGASGAIWGLFGAAFVLERQGINVLGGNALGLIVLNVIFTFAFPLISNINISVGGHFGGLAGGALAALALSRFGRGHAAYGRLGLIGIAGVVAVGVLSVVLAVIQVDRYT